MRTRMALLLGTAMLVSACAQMETTPDETAGEERMKRAADRYTTCVTTEAEKEVGNPAGVEDIAVAAHGRCWTAWDAYRATTVAVYTANAQTREEKQLANDRVHAHLRQFEQDSRRSVMDRLVQRSMTRTK